jgi:hypothetical protein
MRKPSLPSLGNKISPETSEKMLFYDDITTRVAEVVV